VQVALLFVFFHKRLCGPLANTCFRHQPDPAHRPKSKLEAAYHKADQAIQQIVNLRRRRNVTPANVEVFLFTIFGLRI
jgi:hypothetical protein